MSVNTEISERGLFHRLEGPRKQRGHTRRAPFMGASIDHAISDAARSNLPLRYRVARPRVVLAAAPALVAVAAVLRNRLSWPEEFDAYLLVVTETSPKGIIATHKTSNAAGRTRS